MSGSNPIASEPYGYGPYLTLPPTPTPPAPAPTITISDMVSRIQALLPFGWFGNGQTPVLTALLTGIAVMWVWLNNLIGYVADQGRITTATDVNLDMIAVDFFGPYGLLRKVGESDDAYRARILSLLLAPANTPGAVVQIIKDYFDVTATVFEPAQAGDTGAYGSGPAAQAASAYFQQTGDTSEYQGISQGLAWNTAGGYGSLALPYQAFVTLPQPLQNSLANVAGYTGQVDGSYVGMPGGYDVGAIEWISLSDGNAIVTADEIYSLIASTMSAGTIAWTQITGS